MSAGSIPNDAFGVVVEARTDWQPFLLGVIGVVDWSADASATAFTPGESIGGGIMPARHPGRHASTAWSTVRWPTSTTASART